jgi:hypothetical protein
MAGKHAMHYDQSSVANLAISKIEIFDDEFQADIFIVADD